MIIKCSVTIGLSLFHLQFQKFLKKMYIRLFDFVTKNKIVSLHQYGFMPNRSTYMAINDLYCKISDDLDNKHHSLGIFLYLSKVFDNLNYDILLHKPNINGTLSGALQTHGFKITFPTRSNMLLIITQKCALYIAMGTNFKLVIVHFF